MIKNKGTQLLYVIIFITSTLSAQNTDKQHPIFLEIGSCMNQYEYTYSEFQRFKAEYYDYHVALTDYETAILKVDKFEKMVYTTEQIPKTRKVACGSNLRKVLGSDVLEEIHNQERAVYIVKPIENGYEVAKVTNAAYSVYLPDDKYLRYVSEAFYFDYNGKKEYELGSELQKTEGNEKFTLIKKAKQSCLDKVTFMNIPLQFTKATSLEFVMGIGFIREYSDEMERKLVAINGTPLENHLATLCNDKPVENTDLVALENETKSIKKTKTLPLPPTKPDYKTVVANTINDSSLEEDFGSVTITQPTTNDLIDKAAAEVIINSEFATKGETNKKTINKNLIDQEAAEVIINSEFVAKGETDIVKEIIEGYTIEYPYTPKTTLKEKDIQPMGKKIHTVQEGENLYRIALLYNTTVLKIKALNTLDDNRIEIGQDLYVE